MKPVRDLTDRVMLEREKEAVSATATALAEAAARYEVKPEHMAPEDLHHLIEALKAEMKAAADRLEFEKAAALRDRIFELKKHLERMGH